MAVNWLKPIKDKHPNVSWADLMQLASATSVEVRVQEALLAAALLTASTNFWSRATPCLSGYTA
jgi:hypothetical protein